MMSDLLLDEAGAAAGDESDISLEDHPRLLNDVDVYILKCISQYALSVPPLSSFPAVRSCLRRESFHTARDLPVKMTKENDIYNDIYSTS